MCDLTLDGGVNMDLIKDILDKVIKEEYGGCDPSKDEVCTLKAMVSDGHEGYGARIIYVWVVGKWRPVGRTGWKGLPSNKVVAEAIQRIRINTGSRFDENKELYSGTFGGKEIELEFIKFGVSADTLRG